MSEKLESPQSVTSISSSAQKITVPASLTPGDGVYYFFEGDHSEPLYLLSDSSQSNGLIVESGTPWVSGPWRGVSGGRPKWLKTSTGNTTSATVHVVVMKGIGDVPLAHQSQSQVEVNADVEMEPERDSTSASGTSTGASWSWTTFDPQEGWAVKALSFFIEETGGAESAEFQLYGTNKNSPSSPSGADPDDWFQITGVTTLSASADQNVNETTNADQLAVGLKNGSGSATVSWVLRAYADSNTAQLISTLEQRIGATDNLAAGYDSSGSLIEQAREFVKTLGDDDNATPAGHKTAGTVLATLLQLQEDLGDETNATAAGHNAAGDVQEQVLQTQKAIGDETDGTASSIVEDPANNPATLVQLIGGLIALVRGFLFGADNDDEARTVRMESVGGEDDSNNVHQTRPRLQDGGGSPSFGFVERIGNAMKVGLDDISAVTGDATEANSLPVTLSSDESTIITVDRENNHHADAGNVDGDAGNLSSGGTIVKKFNSANQGNGEEFDEVKIFAHVADSTDWDLAIRWYDDDSFTNQVGGSSGTPNSGDQDLSTANGDGAQTNKTVELASPYFEVVIRENSSTTSDADLSINVV